ncbi:GNAT family N-acetyltransferase [Rhodovibrionaceae bacterium A322]
MTTDLPVLESPRLLLVPLAERHLEDMVRWGQDPQVMRYIGDILPVEDLRERYRGWISAGGCLPGLGTWVVSDKTAPEQALGMVFYCPLPDTDFIELGYRYGPEAWGKGIATEAGRLALNHGFAVSDLEQITAVTDPGNAASQKVLTKMGLIRRDDIFAYGETLPFFSLTRAEWEKRAPAVSG